MTTTMFGNECLGHRVTEAREVRCVNQIQLAEMVGVSRQSVSSWENDRSQPSGVLLDRMASILNVPIHRFGKQTQLDGSKDRVFYRSLASATKAARVRAEHRLRWIREDILPAIESLLIMPESRLPTQSILKRPDEICDDEIEEAALRLRSAWGIGLGPISNVTMLAENHGVFVVEQDLHRSLQALSHFDEERKRAFVVMGSNETTAVRSRFGLAHELGHLMMHRNLRRGSARRVEMHKLLEKQAHRFAQAFLVPAEPFIAEFRSPTLNGFLMMKSRWRVSIAALIKRAFALDLIDKKQYSTLNVQRSTRKYTKMEPFDEEWAVERGSSIRQAVELVIKEGVLTPAELEEAAVLKLADIESAIGMVPGDIRRAVKDLPGGGLSLRLAQS